MTIPLDEDRKATFLGVLRELRKSLPNDGPDDVAAIMYLHDRVTESDQGRPLSAYVEAAHRDPVAVRITGPVNRAGRPKGVRLILLIVAGATVVALTLGNIGPLLFPSIEVTTWRAIASAVMIAGPIVGIGMAKD